MTNATLNANSNSTNATLLQPPLRFTWTYGTITKHSIMWLLILCGIIGNLLTLYAIIKLRRKKKSSIYETLLISLALADLGILVITFPVSVLVGPMVNWHIGRFACYVLIPLNDTFVPASTLTLLLIAMLRYRAIVYPMKQRIPAKLVGAVLGMLWTVAISIAIIPFTIWLRAIDIPTNSFARCIYTIPPISRKIWSASCFLLLLIIPLMMIWVIYWKIRKELFRPFEGFRERSSSVISFRRARENEQAIRMILIVTVVFTVLIPPWFIVTILRNFLGHRNAVLLTLHDIAVVMTCMNSAVNCFIYCIYNKAYRAEIAVLFKCTTGKRINPSKYEFRTEYCNSDADGVMIKNLSSK